MDSGLVGGGTFSWDLQLARAIVYGGRSTYSVLESLSWVLAKDLLERPVQRWEGGIVCEWPWVESSGLPQYDGGVDLARHAAHLKDDWNGVWSNADESAAGIPRPREAGGLMGDSESQRKVHHEAQFGEK